MGFLNFYLLLKRNEPGAVGTPRWMPPGRPASNVIFFLENAIKKLPGCCGTTAALEPGYGCRSFLIRWLSPLDQRLSEICQTIRFMPELFTVG